MCCGLGSDRSSQYRKKRVLLFFFWKFLVTCCRSGQHSAPFHLWKAQTHKELTFPRGKLRERPQVPSEAPSGQRQRRGDRVTVRRERGRKKEKTEKDIWAPQVEEQVTAPWQPESQSLHGLGTQWGLPGGSWSGVQRSCLPLHWGSGLFPCISTKR